MKLPGPDHPITIAPNPKRVVVTFAGHVVADTKNALTLQESTYPAVQYIPRGDVDMTLLQRTTHGTECPYKGHANYFSLRVNARGAEERGVDLRDALPRDGGDQDHLAFYPNRVDSIEEKPV